MSCLLQACLRGRVRLRQTDRQAGRKSRVTHIRTYLYRNHATKSKKLKVIPCRANMSLFHVSGQGGHGSRRQPGTETM